MSASSSRRQSFAALRLSRIGMWRCPSEADFLPPNSIRGLLSQPNESSIFPDNGVADLGYILFSLGSEEDELRLAIAIQTDNGGSDDGSVSGTSSGDQAGAADESLSDDSDSNTSTNGVETSLPPLRPKSLNSPVSASLPNSLIHVGPSPSDRVQSPLTVCTIPLVDKSSGPSKGRKKDKNLSKVIRDEEGESGDNRKGARPPQKISSPNLSSPISSRFSSFFSTSVPSIPIPTHGLSSGESSASFQLLAVLTSPNSSSGESPSSLLPPYGSSAILQRSIIKPISKGAFGSVYLAKKRITGDYYAIKVLRKSDMIAKNQRMILSQLDSPFVVKLYFSFQSRDNLYLWAKQYICEVVLDLKPDNLLIDHNGHLKLTDFGLSRSGFLGHYFNPLQLHSPSNYISPSRSMSAGASPSASPLPTTTPPMAPQGVPQGAPQGGVVSLFRMNEHHNRTHSRRSSVASTISTGSIDGSIGPLSIGSRNQENAEDGGKDRKNFAGTPDYLAPESILGLGQDAGVDWWALGVILYEFIYGFPPFHAPTPQDVFENILARRINWLEDEVEVSPECRDMMERLMCTSVEHRFGRNGAEEVKQHFFFADVKWDTLQNSEASFVPKPANAEDTDYFDDRGATNSKLSEGENRVTEEDASPNADDEDSREDVETRSALPKTKQKTPADHDDACSQASDEDAPDFGEFVYKNLPLLEKANSDLVKKLRSDLIALDLKGTPFSASLTGSGVSTPGSLAPPRGRSRNLSMSEAMPAHGLGNSLAGTSSPLTPGTPPPISSPSSSQPQEPSLKTKQRLLDDSKRRNSPLPSSVALIPPGTPTEHPEKRTSIVKSDTPASYLQNAKLALRAQSHGRTLSGVSEPQQEIYPPGPFGGRALDVLIADDNPVACKILEAMLTRMNCRCLVVRNGSEALRYAIGEVKFDVIFMDIRMPIIDGETAARMIKSTKNVNQQTPIIAVTAYEQTFAQTQQFDDVMSKPVTKDLLFKVLAAVAGDHTA
ncbi:hypothetical protein BC829DRAFT_385815 [Chytridium lagenaria]|nr:hypothetical protein BC829DRAFT_385815 [Chytridium lagenaria]